MTEPSARDPNASQQQSVPAAAPPPSQQPVHPTQSPMPGLAPGYPPPPSNNMGWAVGAVLLCLPFAIAALIKSNEVIFLWAQGRFQEAEAASADAKKWGKIGVIVGAVGWGLFFLFYVAIFAFILIFAPSMPS